MSKEESFIVNERLTVELHLGSGWKAIVHGVGYLEAFSGYDPKDLRAATTLRQT